MRTTIFACLLVSGASHAADWLSLGKTDDGNSETFVDRSTIQVVGSVRSALFKYVPEHHLDMLDGKWIERSEQFSEYDCKKNAVHTMQLVIYLEGGGTHTKEYPIAWGSVRAPWDQAALGFLCAWPGE